MTVLLDTDVMSAILTGRGSEGLRQRLQAIAPALRCTSTITIGELLYGIERTGRHEHLRERLESDILPTMSLLPFDEEAAREYAVLRVSLERQGQTLQEADLRIAAIALANGLALITGNARHFRRIPGLRVSNWLDA